MGGTILGSGRFTEALAVVDAAADALAVAVGLALGAELALDAALAGEDAELESVALVTADALGDAVAEGVAAALDAAGATFSGLALGLVTVASSFWHPHDVSVSEIAPNSARVWLSMWTVVFRR
jgi:hypothetical protein